MFHDKIFKTMSKINDDNEDLASFLSFQTPNYLRDFEMEYD